MNQYSELLNSLDKNHVKLLAVSKTHSIAEIMEIYDQGQRDFGENRVQELVEKAEQMPEDIRWHQIGPLQSNKIADVVPHVAMIHSGTRLKVFKYVEKYARQSDKIIDMLIQVHIAEEDSKSGFDIEELMELLEKKAFDKYEHIRIRGLMGMATFTDDEDKVRNEFRQLKTLYDKIRGEYFDEETFDVLSMGMSSDYQIAIEEGATIVRIGSLIFGKRDYS